MLNHRKTKIQFESLATLQAIQKQAYQMLMQGWPQRVSQCVSEEY